MFKPVQLLAGWMRVADYGDIMPAQAGDAACQVWLQYPISAGAHTSLT